MEHKPLRQKKTTDLKKSSLVRPLSDVIDTVKNTRRPNEKKVVRQATQRRRIAIAQMLANDPMTPVGDMVKRFKITRRAINFDIKALREAGNKDAIFRLERFMEIRETVHVVRKNIREYVEGNPNCTVAEIVEATGYEKDQVHNAIKYFRMHKKPLAVNLSPIVIATTMRKKQIVDFLMCNPQANQREIHEATGIPLAAVSRLIKEIDGDIKMEITDKRAIVMNYIFEELLMAKKTCEDRLTQLKSPAHGARYIELILQSLKQMAALYRLGGPENEINVNVSIDKDQRDAAGQAVAESLTIKTNLQLPDLTAGGMGPD